MACAAIAIAGCAHSPVRTSDGAARAKPAFGQWRGKALITDPRDGKQRAVSLDVLAEEPDRLRVDVTGAVGAYIGTFASARGRFAFLSAIEKTYVVGPAESAVARETLRLSIDPREAVAILLGGPLSKDWSCSPADGQENSRKCESRSLTKVSVAREGDSLRVLIQSPADKRPAELRLETVRTNVLPEERQFQLERPRGFSLREVGRAADERAP